MNQYTLIAQEIQSFPVGTFLLSLGVGIVLISIVAILFSKD